MRALATSLVALLAAFPALAEDVVTQAPVAAVTVYPAGAELTHRATVDLPAGTHRVLLPYAGIDDLSSLPRIRTSEGVAIGTLGFQRAAHVDREALFTPAQAEAWATLETARDAVTAKQDEIAAARAEVTALTARLDFLAAVAPGEGMDAAALIALADTLQTETAAAEAARVAAIAGLRPLEDELETLETARDKAEAAFDRLSPPALVSDMLTVELTVAEAGPVTLELTELTRQAWWEMDYDLDLDRDAGQLDVSRKVIVAQDTGASWTDVALTLSTARPGEEVSPSPVTPDRARIYEPEPIPRTTAGTEMLTDAAPPMPEPMLLEGDMKTAELQIDGLAISYAYPEPVTIAASEAAELALDQLALAAEPAIHASPRHDETAFTVASFTNTTAEPILPGWANILRDGHLVGRERIDMIPAGAETELGFGPIEGIRLATIFERNEEGDTGIISKSNTRTQRITFTVENLTGEAQDLTAFFPLTFSEQEDLQVKVAASPAPDETDIERMRGVSAWNMALAPGELKEVNIDVELDWPEGQELVWYP